MKKDNWYMFPAHMGEHQGFIACNYAFGEIAEQDELRTQHLVIRVAFKNADENGLLTEEEYPAIKAIDDKLSDSLNSQGAIYVGRITVDGHRYFHYYTDLGDEEVMDIIQQVATAAEYEMQYILEEDAEKKNYWEEIYPTDDDWQVIRDLKVLDVLSENGDIHEIEREVLHWAVFEGERSADEFAAWATQQGYMVKSNQRDEEDNSYVVHFVHTGTMELADISDHTININRKVIEFGGEYDGWETSVEKAVS